MPASNTICVCNRIRIYDFLPFVQKKYSKTNVFPEEKPTNDIREDKEPFSSYAAKFLLINKAKMIFLNGGIFQ